MRLDWRKTILWVVGACVAFLSIAPLILIVPMSFSTDPLLGFPPTGFTGHWYTSFFTDPTWTEPAVNSLEVALLTVVLATVLGTITALGLVRGRFPGKSVVNALALAPALIPVVLFAIGTFFVESRLGLTGTMRGLVLAHTTLALPFVIVTVVASLRTLDPTLELAAASLGASPLRTFVGVTLPLIAPGVIAGAIFAFVTSWDEVVTAVFLTTPLFHTLPVELWSQLRFEIQPTIAAVSTMLAGLTVVLIVAMAAARRLLPWGRT